MKELVVHPGALNVPNQLKEDVSLENPDGSKFGSPTLLYRTAYYDSEGTYAGASAPAQNFYGSLIGATPATAGLDDDPSRLDAFFVHSDLVDDANTGGLKSTSWFDTFGDGILEISFIIWALTENALDDSAKSIALDVATSTYNYPKGYVNMARQEHRPISTFSETWRVPLIKEQWDSQELGFTLTTMFQGTTQMHKYRLSQIWAYYYKL